MSPEGIAIIGLFIASISNSVLLYIVTRNIENIYKKIG